MHIELEYNGKVYVGADDGKVASPEEVEKMADTFYHKWAEFDRLQLVLWDGSRIVFGKGVIQLAILRVVVGKSL